MAISLIKPTIHGDNNNWGVDLNADLTAIETAFNAEEAARIAAVADLQTQLNNEILMD